MQIRPRPDVYNNLGNAHLAAGREPEAIRAYELALALDVRHAESQVNLGITYAQQDRHEEARRCFAAAGRLRPDKPLWAWRSLSLCPPVFSTAEAVEKYRRELAARLDSLDTRAWRVDLDTLARDGFCPSFHLSHHGQNDRPLKEKFAALFEPHIPRRRPRWRGGKPRIGFLVTRGHEGGFLRGAAGIVERLDAARFDPVVLCSESIAPRCRKRIRRENIAFVSFPDHFRKAVEQIAEARCAVLYHWQADTDAMDYLLPFAGLAPTQCTSWGTHGTSGVAAMDYYLSSELVETPDADSHYTETLHRLSTLPTFQPRVAPPRAADRAEFGLPERGNLYLCPQRLAKLHPDSDPLLAAILRADPAARLVVLAGRNPRPREQLLRRWRGSLAGLTDRIVFVPEQRPADFTRLLSLADVVLDPPHYSAGLTGYDVFSLHLPLVTWPGRFNVQRYAAALYRKMGLDDLIARSAQQYVELAVGWAADPDLRRSIRARIARRPNVLFEDRAVVEQFEQFLERALDQAQ